MKYALIATVEGSVRSFMLPLAYRLKYAGAEVYLICNMSDSFIEQYSKDFNCINVNMERGIDFFNMIQTICYFYKVFKNNKINVIEYGTENASFCASIAGKLAAIPVRIYNHWGARYIGFSGIMRMISIIIEKIAAMFSTDIRQVSIKNMEMCIRDKIYPAAKVKVLGLGGTVGVDTSRFDLSKKIEFNNAVRTELGIPKDAFILGFVGRIQKDKGVNELLSAYRHLTSVRGNTYLLMIGVIENNDSITTDLWNWASSNNTTIFTGAVHDVERYISTFNTMVHPTYREGFGMVLQEAGAMKTPIITTNTNGPAEFITNMVNGILVEPKTVDELYEAMLCMHDEIDLRETLAENVYKHTINNFERNVMLNRMFNDRMELVKKARIDRVD